MKTAKAFLMLFPLFLSTSLLAAPESNKDRGITIHGFTSLEVTSAYVWRGRIIRDEPCIQPYIRLNSENIGLAAWGTYDLTDDDDSAGHRRVDVIGDWTYGGSVQLFKAGAVAYIYRDTMETHPRDTYELFLDYALNVFGLPAVSVYYDFGQINGYYASLSLGHSFMLSDTLSVDASVSCGAADEDYSRAVYTVPSDEDTGREEFVPEGSSYVDFKAGFSAPVSLGGGFEITPSVEYSSLLDSEISDAMEAAGLDTEKTYYSLTITRYF
ncbi:MAG: MipA/OmpV family protein [Kiritimatiellia bacterium]